MVSMTSQVFSGQPGGVNDLLTSLGRRSLRVQNPSLIHENNIF